MPLRLERQRLHARRCGAIDALADRQLRQHGLLLFELRGRIVAALDVRAAEAGKFDGLARRGEDRILAVGAAAGNLHGGPQHARIHHLRRHRPFPDQLVDAGIVAIESDGRRRGREVRRPNRFVRFLRVLHFRRVAARAGMVLVAEHAADRRRRFSERLLAERRRIGAVIGDVAVLEQPLRRLHRALGGEAQLAAGLLRQRRRGERRRGPLDARLLVDGADGPRNVLPQRVDERRAVGFRQDARVLAGEHALLVEVLSGGDARVAEPRQRRDELASVARQLRLEIPIRRSAKREALFFTIDDQPDGDALHAARAQAGLHFLPEHRRDRVAVEPIENAAALLRADQVLVDVLRVLHRLLDGLFRDLMEDDPPDRHSRLEDLLEVPADRLAFTVRVGREIDLRGALERRPQRLHVFPFVVGDDVIRREVPFGVDAEASPLLLANLVGDFAGGLRQIADVAVARPHFVAVFQNPLDRPRLGRRLDDHQCLRHSLSP